MRSVNPTTRRNEAIYIMHKMRPDLPINDYHISQTIDNILDPQNTYHPQRRNRSARSEPWF